MRKISAGELYSRCKEKHQDKFDYSKTNFENGLLNSSIIICRKHPQNELPVTLKDHLRYKHGGCYQCDSEASSSRQRMTKSEFIEKASSIHGNKYSYELVHPFNNQHELVWITCGLDGHGPFAKSPANHLHKSHPQGCPICGTLRGAQKQSSSSAEFIEKSKVVHGNLYDYSTVEYVRSTKKISIICPKHGEFDQTPNDHLQGYGCYDCGIIKGIEANKTLTTEIVVERCQNVWGDRYDYSCVTYVDDNTPITVVCPINGHGAFRVDYQNHVGLRRGCHKCGSKRRAKQNAWLNSLNVPDDFQHREVTIKFDDGTWVFADGFDPVQNIVYEFWGDFWHGNPKVYGPEYNVYGKSTGERFFETQEKRRKYFAAGYQLIEIWENEWDNLVT